MGWYVSLQHPREPRECNSSSTYLNTYRWITCHDLVSVHGIASRNNLINESTQYPLARRPHPYYRERKANVSENKWEKCCMLRAGTRSLLRHVATLPAGFSSSIACNEIAVGQKKSSCCKFKRWGGRTFYSERLITLITISIYDTLSCFHKVWPTFRSWRAHQTAFQAT